MGLGGAALDAQTRGVTYRIAPEPQPKIKPSEPCRQKTACPGSTPALILGGLYLYRLGLSLNARAIMIKAYLSCAPPRGIPQLRTERRGHVFVQQSDLRKRHGRN
jgi:hypothetical protein